MNLNDKRIQAYTKTAQGAKDDTVGKVRTHMDELMKRDGLLKSAKPAGGAEKQTQNQAQNQARQNAQSGAASLAGSGSSGADSVYRRVAKFLLLIGVNEAAKILPHLTAEQTEKIIPELASIRSVDPDEASVIFAEFQSLLERSRQSGGVQTARTILEKAFGADKAQAMLEKTVSYPDGTPFDYLQEISAERLSQLLKDESAPVQALVLSRLKPALAAAFIKSLDRERQKDIIGRMAKLSSISSEVVRRVDRAMREKSQTLSTETGTALDGRGVLAEILKKMDPESEKSILSVLDENDAELGADVRKRLFTLDDIIRADDRFIQETLRSMSDGDLALLIAGKPEEFREKILTNVSKDRGDSVLEEEQLKKPIRKRDADEVTDAFFGTLRRAWEQGKLAIKGRDDDVFV
ncbi:flagellar motor switch protein FliG [Treponema maltophilum ATCC 51939]|uniref:Flagellar motor switch protein FliG n=1 Tax=Treponema maltophilum ATCC 51939 TaxID=1125699 RepID=S3K0U0_TREMA|nr:flagellar motor switch protein FliG [Treponema maltophilum]EPF30506.1 flagellar motor switch protein FliG [Treponema maltophilum ATCC 51939]